MKAPEKIYLQEPTKVRTEKKYDNDVEYIRIDAFIAKAWEWVEDNLLTINQQDNSMRYLEEFRKAMNI